MGIKENIGLFFTEWSVDIAAEGRIPEGTNARGIAEAVYGFNRGRLSAFEAVAAARELGRIEGWLGEYIIRKKVALNRKPGDSLGSFGAWLRSDVQLMRHAQRNGVVVNRNRHFN